MTHKEWQVIRRQELDADWRRRYPNGQYTVQVWLTGLDYTMYGIYHNYHRRDSCYTYRCEGVTYSTLMRGGHATWCDDRGKPAVVTSQNNSFGRCTYYVTLASALAGASRRRVPQSIIDLAERTLK
jgi:hypothetical protein